MSNNKIMTSQEWCKIKYGLNAEQLPTGDSIIQSYAEYYHAEKIHIYTGDQLQAAKEYSKVCINAHHKDMAQAAWIAGNNAKSSDAVEFLNWVNKLGLESLQKNLWKDVLGNRYTSEQLYSQFQNRDK
jgi:hypothetical protein